ncbi:MAG: M50 family metallopeptidase [Oceanicaulis sp.]
MADILSSGLLSIAAFLVVMSFVVVLHELGHYWAGRAFGVHAEVFSIGMGPGLFGWTDRVGTRWVVAALPLGGYVRFRGDENAASAPDREALARLRREHAAPHTVFHFQPVWRRAVIVAAGPVMNFILAIALFAVLGLAVGRPGEAPAPELTTVQEDSAGEAAGFEVGDRLLTMDGREVTSFIDVRQYVATRAGVPIIFEVERGGETLALTVTPARTMRPDGLGGERAFGFLGIGVSGDAIAPNEPVGLLEAPVYGVERTVEIVNLTVDYLARLVTGRASLDMLNGPVGIATTAGQLANNAVDGPGETAGDQPVRSVGSQLAALALSLLTLSALLSVALGLMNLLPIPVLDGGHLVYYAYEAVAGRPPSPAIQEAGFRIGLGLILCMLVVATWNDLSYLRGLFF